jgi:tetratricopeptide (TPR) repeat protein
VRLEEGESTVPDDAPSAAQIRAALDELLGWQGISRSPQLAELLKYVVERTLAGDEGAIKAYSIAVDVFGRPQSFDPQADPIVRVQARRLRTLLEQFYDTGSSVAEVQIHLPLGRYVPEFTVGPKSQTAQPKTTPRGAGATRSTKGTGSFWPIVALGLGFTLVGVTLAVVIIRWWPTPTLVASTVPDVPQIVVGRFDNLTGEADLDDSIGRLQPQIAGALSKFETLEVDDSASGDALRLRGTVQKTGDRFDARVALSEGGDRGTAWTATISATGGDVEALQSLASQIVTQLGAPRGPVQAPGRSWLATRPQFPADPDLYVCELQFMAWRETRRIEDAASGADCFSKILAGKPDDAIALAGHAALAAWQAQHEAVPGASLSALLVDETVSVARAVSLRPQSSFVNEMQGLVLARQNAFEAASVAYQKALQLNPANMDATASYGLRLWLDGQFEAGSALAERALTGVPSPPPWYYQTRAFNALRERRYFDAIDAAQALAAADNEYGAVIALAAAPEVGRTDLVDRYRPLVLGNTHFQSVGILPRLGILIRPQVLLDRVKEGLTLAGVPPAALVKPFNADGTVR